ncbi:Protein glycosylation K [Halioglobus japonicus]|nr:Protein glycosylation K [Halioglobus japonicus]
MRGNKCRPRALCGLTMLVFGGISSYDPGMIDTFLKLFNLLTRKQKREFYLLQVVMVMASIAELISTVSIMPFIALAANPDVVQSNQYISQVYALMGSPSHELFLFYAGAGFVALVMFSNGLMLADHFLLSRYSARLGGEISNKLYGYYLDKDVLFHSATNSATLIQRVMRDSVMMGTSLIAPALKLNARLFSILLLSALIVWVDPMVAIATVVILGSVYWFIFYIIRGKVYRNGKKISELGQKRNRLLNESFGGVRDMKLYSFEPTYLRDYSAATKSFNRATADNMILGDSPSYIVETAVFTGMVLLTLYLYESGGGLQSALPMLTLYGMAGMKMVPKLQQSYLAITRIRGAQAAFYRLYEDLKAATGRKAFGEDAIEPLRPASSIELRDITFGYRDDLLPVFEGYSAHFKVGEMTAVVGASGAGKSTLLDILMGLVEPEHGGIYIDGERVSSELLAAWRATIGYVPQEVYLTDTSPAANIAFGVKAEDIDMDRVVEAAKAAKIHNFIESLPGQYQAAIGERGAQFSGGQKQRVGLARAFYRQVSVLILDEATSALDSATQADILVSLKNVESEQTVIMVTHRAETVEFADQIIRVGSE